MKLITLPRSYCPAGWESAAPPSTEEPPKSSKTDKICACSIEPHRSIPRHTGRVIAGRRMSGLFRDGMGLPAMTLARLYDQHAEECARSAEQTEDDKRRALLLKLAAEWRREADKLRQQATKE